MVKHIDTNKIKASIYICIEEPYLGRVKIGRTSQTPIRREQAIQVGNPNTVKIIHITEPIKHHKIYENALHKAYKNYHIRGEWYQLEQWQVDDLINNLREDEEILTGNDNHSIANLIDQVYYYGGNEDEPEPKPHLRPVEYKMIKTPQGKQRIILRYKHHDTLYVHKDSRRGYCVSAHPTHKDNLIEINNTLYHKSLKELKCSLNV